ncbi:ArnT family glycosyltransferase [Streptomyces acidicola]|uniref:ArnT family glycosyltransferase n=1 Tax=Streptomyces acidicola TaxID=2596892 RepID=UPI0037F2F897
MPQTAQPGQNGIAAGVRPPAHGVTALCGGRTWRSWRTWHPGLYAVFGGLFWLVMTLAYWRVPLCCDAGQHAAVVERLKADLLHPAHPMADLPGAGSPYYSPYAVAQGALARLTGLSGWEAVRLAGPVNLAVLLTGIGRFVRTLTPRPWAPALAVLFMTLLWGTERVLWSGYLGLMSMTTNLGYPSAFAIGLTFWAWAITGTHARGARAWRGYAGLGVLYGLIVLVHPITAVASLTGAVAIVAAWQRSWRGPVVGRWALTGAVALTVAVAWPYFDVLALPGNTGVDGIHRRLYEHMGGHFWLALLGVPALWARARRAGGGGRWWRAGRDPLVLMFTLECLVVAYGWTSGHYTYGRILGLTAVPPQFALAVELAAPRPWAWARRALGAAAAAGACVGFLAQAGAVVPRSLDPVGFAQPPQWPGYGWAARHIRPGEVVITDGYYAGHAIAGYGPNLVAPAWPDPALDERERARRLAEVRAYLDPASTRAERTAIARRYHVRWLLLTRWRKVPEEAVVVDRNRRTGEVLARLGAARAEPATR